MKILCIGDSLTYGYKVVKEKRWINLLEKNLGIPIINSGALGDSTAGMLMRSYTEICNTKPDVVFIMGGTNDFLMNRSAESVIVNIKYLIEEIKKLNIKLILGIQPPTVPHLAEKFWVSDVNYKKVNDKIVYYRDWAKNYCVEQNFLYVDFFYEFVNNIGSANNFEEFYIDGLHLNSKGHDIMYRTAYKIFYIL